MQIVRFETGGYAVRRFNWFYLRYEYLSLNRRYAVWFFKSDSNFDELCVGKLSEAKESMKLAFDNGTPLSKLKNENS